MSQKQKSKSMHRYSERPVQRKCRNSRRRTFFFFFFGAWKKNQICGLLPGFVSGIRQTNEKRVLNARHHKRDSLKVFKTEKDFFFVYDVIFTQKAVNFVFDLFSFFSFLLFAPPFSFPFFLTYYLPLFSFIFPPFLFHLYAFTTLKWLLRIQPLIFCHWFFA